MTVGSTQSFSIHVFFNEILYVQTCKYPVLKVIGPQKNTCTMFSLPWKWSEKETCVALAHVWVWEEGTVTGSEMSPHAPWVCPCGSINLCRLALAQFTSPFQDPLQGPFSLKKIQAAYTAVLSKYIVEEVLCYAAVK